MLRKLCIDHMPSISERQHLSPSLNFKLSWIFIQPLPCLTFTKGIQFVILLGLQIKKVTSKSNRKWKLWFRHYFPFFSQVNICTCWRSLCWCVYKLNIYFYEKVSSQEQRDTNQAPLCSLPSDLQLTVHITCLKGGRSGLHGSSVCRLCFGRRTTVLNDVEITCNTF